MTTLHERLRDLAEDAPTPLSEPDLWDRGRRYATRRRTGTVLIVGVACLLVVLMGMTVTRPSPPSQPMPANGPMGLPDRVFAPSRWMPGTDEAGEIGPVVALLTGTRGTLFGRQSGLVGVSATTGDYRFLDLPDLYEGLAVDLSPDGRQIAYWYTGDTRLGSGEPDGEPAVAGYAVYDTVTGEVVRQPVPSDHGLYVDGLGWADSQTVVAGYSFWHSAWVEDPETVGAVGATVRVWRPGIVPAPVPQPWEAAFGQPEDSAPVTFVDGTKALGVLQAGSPLRFQRLTLDLDPKLFGHVVPDERGRRAAVVSGYFVNEAGARVSSMPSEVLVADLPGGDYHVVPGTDGTFEVLRWIGDEVVVLAQSDPPGGTVVRAVDVRTGSTRTLVDGSDYHLYRVATGLLTLPSYEAVRPASRPDPRLVGLLTLLVVGLGATGVVLWRRRVRP